MEAFVIVVSKKIENLSIEETVKEISESKYGPHYMLIYPDLEIFREFYTYYFQRQVNLKNEVVLFNPFYETVGYVKQILSMGHIDVDNYRYDSDISLIIADSLDQYFGKVPMAVFKDRLVKVATKKRKDGVSIMSDMGPYFYKMLHQELVGHELSLPQEFDTPLKHLCIYNQLDFDNALTDKQKQELIDHHGKSINLLETI